MEFLKSVFKFRKLVFMGLMVPCYFSGYSQISVHGVPESFQTNTKAAVIIPDSELDRIYPDSLVAEDIRNHVPNRYSIIQRMTIDIKNAGVRTTIAGKGYIWQYKLVSTSSYSLGIKFSRFLLPEGAEVFIYDETHTQLYGAFTNLNNNESGKLSIAEFKGKNATIEYFEPFDPVFPGELEIGGVSQAYIDIQATLSSTTRIGINCPQGADWQDQKHSVCRMTFDIGNAGYYCTGFLVNNVRADGTPYFQTANHCISTGTAASTLITYFNYENSTCSSSDANADLQTLSGSTLKATNAYSDFTLVLLNQHPPDDYVPYYAGWDASSRAPQSGACIHHPAGTPKCISRSTTSAPVSYASSIRWYDDGNVLISTTAANTHWKIVFSEGTTEGGSSGSPLFDDNKRAIGQLHGGSTTDNYYGKFSLSWNYSSNSAEQLKAWLNPDNTSTTAMNGAYLMKPKTEFSIAQTTVCRDAATTLNDQSKYTPSQWKWRITPNTFRFTNSTTQTSQNPSVIFDEVGTYTISLVVSNVFGTDSLVKENYVEVKNAIKVLLSGTPVSSICGSSLNKFPLIASGAQNYTYNVENTEKISYTSHADTIFLSLKSGFEKEGPFSSWVKVKGTFGVCEASDSTKLSIILQTNDNIADATRLWPGSSVTFSNQCATVETHEPQPEISSDCTSSDNWCTGSGDVSNTTWFSFIGPSSGKITISTQGMDTRIAVYDADSYSKILSGSSADYTILGANDNRSSSDKTSILENLSVESGKKYWLQVDGVNGATGTFSIDLLSNSVDVFPNPSSGQFDIIISNMEAGTATVEIFSLMGKLVASKQIPVASDSNHFTFDLSTYPSGMYIIKTTLNGSVIKTKLMIVK
jgi:PKD repeat protein